MTCCEEGVSMSWCKKNDPNRGTSQQDIWVLEYYRLWKVVKKLIELLLKVKELLLKLPKKKKLLKSLRVKGYVDLCQKCMKLGWIISNSWIISRNVSFSWFFLPSLQWTIDMTSLFQLVFPKLGFCFCFFSAKVCIIRIVRLIL